MPSFSHLQHCYTKIEEIGSESAEQQSGQTDSDSDSNSNSNDMYKENDDRDNLLQFICFITMSYHQFHSLLYLAEF